VVRGKKNAVNGEPRPPGAEPLDITSLHFAVAPDRVNIHIGQRGFVFEGANLELMVGPDFADHIVNELVWKTILPLPYWLAERMDVIMPNSTNDFSRFGLSTDMVQRKNLKVTAREPAAFTAGSTARPRSASAVRTGSRIRSSAGAGLARKPLFP
jgi:hypothetical protein